MYGQAELGEKGAARETALEAYAKNLKNDSLEIERMVGELATLALASRTDFSAVP